MGRRFVGHCLDLTAILRDSALLILQIFHMGKRLAIFILRNFLRIFQGIQ